MDQTEGKVKRDRQYAALFNYATIGIVVTDSNGEIVDFNRYAESQFGYTAEEVAGKKIEVLVPEQFLASHLVHRENFYGSPSPRQMGHGRNLFALKKDGTQFPVEISLSHYQVENSTFVIAFIIDITVRKRDELLVVQQKDELEKIASEIIQMNLQLEQKVEDRTKMLRETLAELEKSKEELREALETEKELGELKSRFVTMASHEFRTPLSTILSSAFLLDKYSDSVPREKRSLHIQRIKNAVSGMKGILEDFLSLGRLEEGSLRANIESVTSTECVVEIEETVREMESVLKPGQQINFEHSGNYDATFDKHLLKNILLNLLSNAIKFSPENSIIYINAISKENEIELAVKDSGIGISEEDKYHLFERFFRARNAGNIQGTGLGLHIVTKYLELMNGTIELESELDKGSRFIIHIPRLFLMESWKKINADK